MGAVSLLYRGLLKESQRLPHIYLRNFYLIKFHDRFNKTNFRDVRDVDAFSRKVKDFRKELRRLRAANSGSKKAFTHVLDEAYGRIGKLRWELLKPILGDSEQPTQPIIPSVPRSRPPVYHPLFVELAANSVARKTKPIKKANMVNPPTLPERAIEKEGPEARLLGPFSRRREVNIRWRYFSEQTKRLLPPLEIKRRGLVLGPYNMRSYGFGSGMMKQLVELADPNSSPTIPRRERKLLATKPSNNPLEPSEQSAVNQPLPTRWLRRRYRQLLHTTPVVTQDPGVDVPRYRASLVRVALGHFNKGEAGTVPKMKPGDFEWIRKAERK